MDYATFQRELAFWILTQGVVLLLAVWGIVRGVFAREEQRLFAKIELLVDSKIKAHNDAQLAHPAAAVHYHAAPNALLEKIIAQQTEMHEDIARLIDAHNAAATTGTCITVRARREMGAAKR